MSNPPTRYSSQLIRSVFTVSVQASWVPDKIAGNREPRRDVDAKSVAAITELRLFRKKGCGRAIHSYSII